MDGWWGVLIGFAFGIAGNILVDLGMSFWQYQSSAARHRVAMVVCATREIAKARSNGGDTGILRNKYRYSLGVTIDRLLAKEFGSSSCQRSFKENEPMPSFVDKEREDRWSFFNERVRPVVEDLNSYSFFRLGVLFRLFKLRRLVKLIELCKQLEVVISETDAALGGDTAQLEDDGRVAMLNGAESLKDAYCKLYQVWYDWLRLVGC